MAGEHVHHYVPVEGPLLTPEQLTKLGLNNDITYWYINGRCDIEGCDSFTYAAIEKSPKKKTSTQAKRTT